ncbi:DUF6247 family protein [Microbispora triticiradicis]|uniref:DUF6247 family protein n=1 Tax=Microbispora triticiradicis TaxID=2200763 RepID=UPI001AD75391|nr:DUF6247 family protein [Microbispora triticiradicis]MBO4274570.1 hypothetical protein [Microbispora triticiradicis]
MIIVLINAIASPSGPRIGRKPSCHGSVGGPYDPDDILARLPERYHERFLAEYREAMVTAAHETWRYRQLQEVLQIWHLRTRRPRRAA